MWSMSSPLGQGAIRLVSTSWLMSCFDDGQIDIVDAQPNVHDYIQEHIPGAIYLNEGLFRDYAGGHPARWIAPEAARSIFSHAGLTVNKPVVVYTGIGVTRGWGDGLGQTMVAYTLARYGHQVVYVLNGGIDQWKLEGKPLSQAFPVLVPTTYAAQIQGDLFIEHDEFVRMKDLPDVLLLDARPQAVYEGQGPWCKPGHIPGAVNLPWASLMDAKNKALLKPMEEIEAILSERGVSRDKTIICSCGTGREATNEFLLFKFYLNYPHVRIHEGAFTEWASYHENQTVTGKNPR